MTIDFTSLIFIWLLPLTASSMETSGQNGNFTVVPTGEAGNQSSRDQVTTQAASSLNPITEVSAMQTAPTTPPKTVLRNIQTATTPVASNTSQSTVGIKSTAEVTTSATTVVTSQASNPATTMGVPPMLSNSTQSQDTRKTETSQFTTDDGTHPSTRPTQPTNNSTATTSTKPVENESTSTSPDTGPDATQSTGFYKTSRATTKTPIKDIIKPKKEPENGTSHGKIVAGIIGGALVVMMLGFLFIFFKKRKLQSQQTSTSDWAGPSPFLDGGDDNGQVSRRSSNRISLSSFLPQRLSKRLSLLPETDEEMEEMTPATTFGDKHQGSKSGQEANGNHVQENNGTAVVPEMKSTGDTTETVENSVPVSSSQTIEPPPANTNSEVANLSEDLPANPPPVSGDAENALVQVADGQE